MPKTAHKDISRPWLTSYDRGVSGELDYEKPFLFEYLKRAAAERPDRAAIRFQGRGTSYASLARDSRRIAAALRKYGVKPGDRVAVMLPNMPQTVASYFGVLAAGAVCVMINPLYMETEITHQVGDAECRAMIVLDHLWPRIEKLTDRLPVEKYFTASIADALRFPLGLLYNFKAKREGKNLGAKYDGETVFPWKELTRRREPVEHGLTDPEKDLALIQYTGGTTGTPKGVMITHFNLAANLQQCHAILYALGKGHEKFLTVMPFFHVYGLTTCLNLAVSVQGTIIAVPRYDPAGLVDIIEKEKPTIFPGAPAIYNGLLHVPDIGERNLSSLRFLVSGSAPLSLETMRRFKKMTDAAIIEGYGLTETSPVTHLNPLKGISKLGSIGLPFPDTDAMVVDMETGRGPLAPGEEGELVIRGPQVASGYWNRPDETARAFENGWLYTGDIGYMDDEGYFFITDRKKDMVLVGGYNVYPREVDEVLYGHPDVKEAATVGIKHPSHGEVLKAYVVPRDGVELKKSDIVGYCREKLASYKVPRRVDFLKELPKTAVGKVKKNQLRDKG
jgi:long-chain acyl-CoA synthetase